MSVSLRHPRIYSGKTELVHGEVHYHIILAGGRNIGTLLSLRLRPPRPGVDWVDAQAEREAQPIWDDFNAAVAKRLNQSDDSSLPWPRIDQAALREVVARSRSRQAAPAPVQQTLEACANRGAA